MTDFIIQYASFVVVVVVLIGSAEKLGGMWDTRRLKAPDPHPKT